MQKFGNKTVLKQKPTNIDVVQHIPQHQRHKTRCCSVTHPSAAVAESKESPMSVNIRQSHTYNVTHCTILEVNEN